MYLKILVEDCRKREQKKIAHMMWRITDTVVISKNCLHTSLPLGEHDSHTATEEGSYIRGRNSEQGISTYPPTTTLLLTSVAKC
jgi:hypothetical protein